MRPHLVHWLEALLPGGVASAIAPTWFTCVGLAGVVTLFAMLAIAKRHRLDRGVVAGIVLWCYVGAVAAGIVVPSAIDAAEQLLTTGHAHVRWAGMTSFWGYLAGGCAVAAVCRAHDVPLRRFADLAAAPLGVALMLARLGCFLAGCDYGKVTSLPWAVRFPAHSPAWQDHINAGLLPADRAESLPVHPTQLYEAVLGLAITAIALVLARRRRSRGGDGRVFLIAAAVYALGRIAIEDLRGDAGRGIYLGLSSGQIFSWLVLAALAAGSWLRRFQPLRAATATAVGILLTLIAPDPVRAQPTRPPSTSPQPQATPPSRTTPQPAQPRPGQPIGPALPPAQSQPAQRQPQPPPAQPFGPALPPPAPPTPPAAPYAPPGAAPAAPAATIAAPAATASAEPAGGSTVQLGALVGAATPFNRRRDQVAPLGGGSISIGLGFRQLGLWLDLDSFGNRDASHGTILLSGGMTVPVSSHLWIGGRVGLGATLVNFDDPAFRDVAGTNVRFEALVDYRLGDSWALWLRPLSFDVLSAADLGGPIATWQARIGVAYHFVVGHRVAQSPPQPPPQPALQPPPPPASAASPAPAYPAPAPTPRSR